ncbi:DNA-primase RepB domain-containing protein [Paenibacillus mendelii]|uniref:DNA-primase RepB domain-containing protein n=1 Tax=Paenibacillus mendelii TaxID=206163 RepID=A0ABV6JLB5_9BACL|nr:DNA-primase RepB domain-containing protein [Paenibacillus mendelii]MCQ6562294.1 RepB family DNA primase [Paenibacillus mendelii]
MKQRLTPYSKLVRQSSSQAHQFIKKLGYKDNEQLHFILVHDVKHRNHSSSASSNHRKRAMTLQKPLKLMERLVPQIKLISDNNKPVHLLTQNARGYAVFMEINYRETKDHDFKEIKSQFIDVDLNKISERFRTKEQLMQKLKSIQTNPSEQILSTTIKRTKQGQYHLLVHRTKPRVDQLKKAFLSKHWKRIRNAMIIETKNGFHIYWVVRGGSINRFVPIQKALAHKFGSDPMITNLSRAMRIPGFYHMKDPDKPYLVRVRQWGRKQPFTQDELVHELGLQA